MHSNGLTSSRSDPPGMVIRRIGGDLDSFTKPWDALADRIGAAPFLRPGWILAWSRAFAPGRLSLLTAHCHGELVGVLPFTTDRGVVSAPVNWHTPLFGCTTAEANVAGALTDNLAARAPVRADLAFLAEDDPMTAACIAAIRKRGQKAIIRTILRSPYVEIGGGDWSDYRSSLERGARRDVERRLRRLRDVGAVTLQVCDGSVDLEPLLDEVFQLERSGWKEERGTAIDSVPEIRRFYTDVAHWAADRGWLALRLLRVDGRAIASDLCIDADGVVYSLKGGFDPAFRRFAPGMVMYYESLREAFEKGMRSYEMLGADEPHKMAFASSVRCLVRVQAFSDSLRGMASNLAWTRGRPVALRALGLSRSLIGSSSVHLGRARRRLGLN